MATVYLSLGSNLGDRAHYLATAVEQLGARVGKVLIASAVLETAPWGVVGEQMPYLNQCLALETALPALEVFALTQEIEQGLGRTDKGKRAPRTIDIDILYYDDLVLQSPALAIPHPLAHCREFVLDTMVQIAPAFVHPLEKKTQEELKALADAAGS